jgi:sugar phosphate isomerase/epimerase
MRPGLILDHLTVGAATPLELIQAAACAGFDGVGLFLHAMQEVPVMAKFDLIYDLVARRAARRAAEEAGCRIGITYPFTLSRTSRAADFVEALDAAAELGAEAINILLFDPDRGRRTDSVGALVEEAASRGLEAGIEFFPLSSIPTFEAAIALCDGVPSLKVTVDLLHLNRSGGSADEVLACRSRVLLIQLCDAPLTPPQDLFGEASSNRLLPGEGELDLSGLLERCQAEVPISVEAPVAHSRGLSPAVLARKAHSAARLCLSPAASPVLSWSAT